MGVPYGGSRDHSRYFLYLPRLSGPIHPNNVVLHVLQRFTSSAFDGGNVVTASPLPDDSVAWVLGSSLSEGQGIAWTFPRGQ